MLLASSLKLLGVSNEITGIILVVMLIAAPVAWMLIRRSKGFPALASVEIRDYKREKDAAAAAQAHDPPENARDK